MDVVGVVVGDFVLEQDCDCRAAFECWARQLKGVGLHLVLGAEGAWSCEG